MKRPSKEDFDFEEENQEVEDDLDLPIKKGKVGIEDKDDPEEIESKVEYFSQLTGSNIVESLDVEEEEAGSHPAEVAALFKGEESGKSVGGSDQQILKDLRKMVFSVPLLQQDEVFKLFLKIDAGIFPAVYSIFLVSDFYLEAILQIVIKVAAGNTYGKNIYEKRDDEKNEVEVTRNTYKKHEIRFLKNSYQFIRLYAKYQSKKHKRDLASIESAVENCSFIRGVYEDILKDFIEKTESYSDLHWQAYREKAAGNINEYHKLVSIIKLLDKELSLGKLAFYVSRDASRVHANYMDIRSIIITPYLRSVYTQAKNTAKNAHQMLDNFQNGSMGLIRAISCYSTKRPASFASVAKWWIKQTMLLSIKEDANFVKLPVSTWQAYTQLEKAKVKPGVDEDSIESIAKAAKMPVRKAKAIYQTVKIAQVYSLNKTYDNDEKLTLEDIVTNDDRLGNEPDELNDLLRSHCEESDLSDIEIKVLAVKHGMIDLIKPKEIKREDIIKEALVQNLAALGYNYKI